MPLRGKVRCAELQGLSPTATFFAPAWKHISTSVATTSGLVQAACSGRRSQAMLGFTHTTLPLETNRPIPPSASMAPRVNRLASSAMPSGAAGEDL